jgi:uncharacterized protein
MSDPTLPSEQPEQPIVPPAAPAGDYGPPAPAPPPPPPPPPTYAAPPAPPPGYAVGQPAYASVPGAGEVTSDDRTMAMLAHLGGIIFGFLPSLIIMLVKTDRPFVRNNAVAALNWQITLIIAWFATFILFFIATAIAGALGLILWLLFLALFVGNIAFSIIAGIAANKGEMGKYPWVLELVK